MLTSSERNQIAPGVSTAFYRTGIHVILNFIHDCILAHFEAAGCQQFTIMPSTPQPSASCQHTARPVQYRQDKGLDRLWN